MTISDSIYDYDYRLRNALSLLGRSSLCDRDRELVLSFVDLLTAQGVSRGRLAKYVFHLKVAGERLALPFEDAGRRDIERLMASLHRDGYAPNTVADYSMVMKRFYKFVRCGNIDVDTPYPTEVRWLRKTVKPNERRQPDFFRTDEVKAMIAASSRLRDRAMLAVGFEAGLRAAELLGVDVGDLRFDQLGARLRVRGKTGERMVRLIVSSPVLASYFDLHPFKDDPSAPLWLTVSTGRRNTRVSWLAWDRILKELAERAGIKRRVHNHMLRHGSATHNAKYLTDAELRYYYGWSATSKMPSLYVHLSGQDLDGKLASLYGLAPPDGSEPQFVPVVCPRCAESNTPGTRYCHRCGSPIADSDVARARCAASTPVKNVIFTQGDIPPE